MFKPTDLPAVVIIPGLWSECMTGIELQAYKGCKSYSKAEYVVLLRAQGWGTLQHGGVLDPFSATMRSELTP